MTAARRVLFIITTLDVGGAEQHLLWLAQGLAGRGFQVDVVYLKGAGRLGPGFAAAGAVVRKVPFERAVQAPAAVLALARLIRRGNYELVHTHLLKADALGAVACLLARHRRLVASKHNEEQVLKRRAVGLIHGAVSRVARRVIALSDHVLEYMATTGRVPRDRLRRIYYGIDPARFRGGARALVRRAIGVGDATHVALCVARFHPQKDHPTLFRAAARLAAEGRDFRLLLAGGDPFYGHTERLRELVEELGLASRVLFLGIRDDVRDLLAAADLFVLPSLYEGLGLVFLEAMAAGRPVLATLSSAIPEVVVEGETGLLVAVGDDRMLADRWRRFLDDRELGARLGAAGEARVDAKFTLRRMIDRTVAVYREVVDAG